MTLSDKVEETISVKKNQCSTVVAINNTIEVSHVEKETVAMLI